MIPSVPKARWNSDQRRPPMFRPMGPEVEIARSADWSITVSRSQDGGFCISHSGADGGSGIAAGGLPSPGDDSKRLVMDIGSPAMRKGHVGFVAGLVTPDVARVQVRFRDGTSISAETEAAPDVLDADLRTFVMETPADEQPFGPGFPPWMREHVLFASDGAVLERRTNSRQPRLT
jgi:hypothetical protein